MCDVQAVGESVAIICGRPEAGFAVMQHCGWCDEKTRCLHQVVYGGYGSNVSCGVCGSLMMDGEYDPRPIKSQAEMDRREARIVKVAEAWKNGDQSEQLTAYIMSRLSPPDDDPDAGEEMAA